MIRTVQAKGEGTQPARTTNQNEAYLSVYLYMIFPSYLIHESSMSSKKITEVIMKESVIAK